ncbi:hypothetical protein CRG98_021505, partial [Punica granatum]
TGLGRRTFVPAAHWRCMCDREKNRNLPGKNERRKLKRKDVVRAADRLHPTPGDHEAQPKGVRVVQRESRLSCGSVRGVERMRDVSRGFEEREASCGSLEMGKLWASYRSS